MGERSWPLILHEAKEAGAPKIDDVRRRMSRLNDVGGMHGFGEIERETDEPPFHAEWEARVLVLNRILMQRGLYNLDQFRDAVERIDPAAYIGMPYYERWLTAIEVLLAERGIAT